MSKLPKKLSQLNHTIDEAFTLTPLFQGRGSFQMFQLELISYSKLGEGVGPYSPTAEC